MDVYLINPSQKDDVLLVCQGVEIAFVGCSLIAGMKGEIIILFRTKGVAGSDCAQACIANCAVITGQHKDDFHQLIGHAFVTSK